MDWVTLAKNSHVVGFCVKGNEHRVLWRVQNVLANRETVMLGMIQCSDIWQRLDQCRVSADEQWVGLWQ